MWKFVNATAVGTSHSARGLPCQDDCYVDVIEVDEKQDYLVCIISDGAGSAKAGAKGAGIACAEIRSAIEHSISSDLSECLVREWIKKAQLAIEETAKCESLSPRDYACTLLCAVISPSQTVFFQIGDGAIVASSRNVLGVVFWPEPGQYANITHFLTTEDALTYLQVCVTNTPIEEVALFSDGVQRLVLSFLEQMPHIPFFDSMFQVLRKTPQEDCDLLGDQLAKFLNSAQVNERTDDDKSLILASRKVS